MNSSAVVACLFTLAAPASLASVGALALATPLPVEEPEVEVRLAAEVTSSRFVAVNATPDPQLVLFGALGGGEVPCIVPAFGTLDVPIPHGASGWFWAEFATIGVDWPQTSIDLQRSGPLPLDDLVGDAGDTLWIVGAGGAVRAARVSAPDAPAPVVQILAGTTTSLDVAGHPRPQNVATVTHVPGAGPDGDHGDTPPDVGDKPVPPF